MKSKEPIKLLQIEDPTGEAEVCIDNHDIHFVENVEDYYDGPLEVFIRDLKNEGYYNIIGGKFLRGTGVRKVRIHSYSIEELYIDHGIEGKPFQLDTSCLMDGGYREGNIKIQIKEWDAEIQSVKDNLIEWEKNRKEKENE